LLRPHLGSIAVSLNARLLAKTLNFNG